MSCGAIENGWGMLIMLALQWERLTYKQFDDSLVACRRPISLEFKPNGTCSRVALYQGFNLIGVKRLDRHMVWSLLVGQGCSTLVVSIVHCASFWFVAKRDLCKVRLMSILLGFRLL